ncbi:MAG TPA: secretion system protein [Deltaproteobacteria bacterium]|nr:secretion system protein [Candidatus Binatota bacterium]HIL13200.1 secretion system protein [Deltaproteobacteria bacterium]
MQPVLIAFGLSLSVALMSAGIMVRLRRATQREAVLDRLRADPVLSLNEDSRRSILRDARLSEVSFINELLERISLVRVLERWLVQARWKVRADDVLLRSVLMGLTGVVSMQLTVGSTLLGVGVGAALAGSPVMILLMQRKRRFAAFDRQLPDALTMMKNSLQAGYTLNKAMQVIAEEMEAPVGEEFRDTVEEMRLGVPLSQAMNNLRRRIENNNLDIFITAVLIQFEVGGSLTELLENVSETIRERFRMEGEVKSLTAEGRISGIVVGVLPIALVAIISVMQPDYLEPLLATETGHKLLGLAAVLETLGFLAIRKVSRVNF